MLRTTVVVCAAALALAACSTTDSEPSQYPDEDWKAESSVLEKLTEQQMCDLVSDETIEKAFGTTVNGGKGTKRGKMPVLLVYGCSYETDGLPTITTNLSTTRASKSDQEVLDGVFTDLTKENAPPSEYEKWPASAPARVSAATRWSATTSTRGISARWPPSATSGSC